MGPGIFSKRIVEGIFFQRFAALSIYKKFVKWGKRSHMLVEYLFLFIIFSFAIFCGYLPRSIPYMAFPGWVGYL
jgi:hypothetical protein